MASRTAPHGTATDRRLPTLAGWNELSGEIAATIPNHLQKARGEAAAIEDPSTRRAVESLADAVAALVNAARERRD